MDMGQDIRYRGSDRSDWTPYGYFDGVQFHHNMRVEFIEVKSGNARLKDAWIMENTGLPVTYVRVKADM